MTHPEEKINEEFPEEELDPQEKQDREMQRGQLGVDKDPQVKETKSVNNIRMKRNRILNIHIIEPAPLRLGSSVILCPLFRESVKLL